MYIKVENSFVLVELIIYIKMEKYFGLVMNLILQ